MLFASIPPHLKDKPIVSREEAYAMLITSSVTGFASIYAIYKGHYFTSIIPFGVLLTSINYWRHPTYGIRRNIDVAWCIFSLSMLLIISYNASERARYYLYTILGLICYPLSHYFHNNQQQYMGTLMHGYMHILGGIGLFYLFSGDIPALLEAAPQASATP